MSEHEQAIVAGLLQDPSRIGDLSGLAPEWFRDEGARALFRLALSYRARTQGRNGLDFALARARLERAGSDRAAALLGTLGEYEALERVTRSEFRDAVREIAQARERHLLREAVSAAADAIEQRDYDAVRRELRQGLLGARSAAEADHDQPQNLMGPSQVEEEIRELDRPEESGFDVGFPRLQSMLTFRRQSLTILAGFTSDGKSSLAKTWAYRASQAGAKVLYVSLEMTRREMRVLVACQHAAVLSPPGVRVREVMDRKVQGEERELYLRAVRDLGGSPAVESPAVPPDEILERQAKNLWVWCPGGASFPEIEDQARALKDSEGLDVLIVDHLGLVNLPRQERGQLRVELKDLCDAFKRLARDLDLWGVGLAQISRKAREAAVSRIERNQDVGYYVLGDVGESAGIDQAADTSVYVFTDDDLKDERVARLGCVKNRGGATLPRGYEILADYPRGNMAEKGG